jgi:hypothetical protein
MRHGRVVLTPEALTVTGFGGRSFPWTSIEEVLRVKQLGGHGVRIVVDGRRRGLVAPVHTPVVAPDPRFEEKAATIERYWHAARGGAA